jgi:hypothetical protein
MANVSDSQLDTTKAEKDYENITNPEASLKLNQESQRIDENANKFLLENFKQELEKLKQGGGRLKKTKSRSRSRSKSKSKTKSKR